eukprot:11162290-Lingulodinium_polyedra.AAC.1
MRLAPFGNQKRLIYTRGNDFRKWRNGIIGVETNHAWARRTTAHAIVLKLGRSRCEKISCHALRVRTRLVFLTARPRPTASLLLP